MGWSFVAAELGAPRMPDSLPAPPCFFSHTARFARMIPSMRLLFVAFVRLSAAQTTFDSSRTSASTLALPTNPYTGQALLTGTCATPIFSTLHFSGTSGHDILEVPLIGCSDDRLECCPSLQWPAWSSRTSGTGSWRASTATAGGSSNDGQGTSTEATATGIVSKLNASPLSMCPQDFVNLSPVCCPT